MKSARLIAVGATLTLAVLTAAAPVHADAPTAASILRAGAQKGIADGYPGVVGMVRSGDSAQYVSAGTGNTATKVPADPQAQFRVGSNTKAFIATVLLQLEAEGTVSLDDSVARWLPGAVDANGYDGSRITLRELLNHTSGIPDFVHHASFYNSYAANREPNRAWPPQTLVDLGLALRPPSSEPGEKWEYSNTNYVLAGMVIKAVTGNDPATEVTRRIIEPLGLRHTVFPTSDPALQGNYLHGYAYGWLGVVLTDVTVSNVQGMGAAGAMVSTLDDLATFTRALLDGQLLPPAQEAELKTTVPTGTADIGYGLGISRFQLPCGKWVWSHNGAVLGYFSTWYADDDGGKQVLEANTEYHLQAPTRGQTDTDKGMQDAFCAL
ncbi:serine hydrolase domain-containing protein [Streptomyces achromogenes]|uniref:serine hydrolase domain-containing protein n=1 Tax=Streptomyces achromogenes TaxID=67255 RepID=UPI0036FDF492